MLFERNRWFAVATTLFCTGVALGCSDQDLDPDEQIGEQTQALPLAPTQVGPTGPGISTTPTYVWNSVTGATGYVLYVTDAATAGKIKDLPVTPAEAGCTAPGQCSITPSTVLVPGAAKWWVRARDATGLGPWSTPSAGMAFNVVAAGVTQKPGQVTTIAPTGGVGTTTPTFTWNAIMGAGAASSYKLWVGDASTGNLPKYQQTFTPTAAGCAAGGVCSVTPATALALGAAKFYVLANNAFGDGLWSVVRNFSVVLAPPVPILTNPTGTVTTATPTYEWNASTGATQYNLFVNGAGAPGLINILLTPTQANCNADTTCSFAPATALANGMATFWVRASSPGGTSNWSTARNFTVAVSGDVDECALNTDNCDPAATCTNTPTGFTCTCPAGQIGDGTTCSCNMAGTFAVRDELDIEWDPVMVGFITVIEGGSATTLSWSIRQQTVQNGTLQVSTIPCGATSPDLCSNFFNQAFSQFLPDSIWQGPMMPVGSSAPMPLTDPDPGEAFVTPLAAMLGGITMADPLGPWPSLASTTFFNHDNDANPGMTQQMKTGTSTACNKTYANLPDPEDVGAPRIDRVYVASRLLSSYSGTINSCDRISGNMTGPVSGKPQVNGHVAGCRKVGGAACSSATVTNLDTNGQAVSQRINAARFTMIRDNTPNLTCATVRAKNYAP